MTLDPAALDRIIAAQGAVIRVVVADTAGSVPREAGAAMVVWADGQDGTIGGGALEHEAAATARDMLASGAAARVDRLALGPARGQCCGGAVTLLSERWDAARVAALDGPLAARPLPGQPSDMPLAVRRILSRARSEGLVPVPGLVKGWMIEPLTDPALPVWVWGAGHVGRAIVATLAPLPDLRITWVDTDPGRFPETIPQGVTILTAANPGDLVAAAPCDARHLVLTYSHPLDLDLCHRLLVHGFAGLGLIGSATKRARFRSRLAALGHGAAAISRIDCPIGIPALGKHPQAIAVGVAWRLLNDQAARNRAGAPQDVSAGGQPG